MCLAVEKETGVGFSGMHGRVGEEDLASLSQPAGMVGMDVGEEDVAYVGRRIAGRRQAVQEPSAMRSEQFAGAGVDQYHSRPRVDEEGVDRGFDRAAFEAAGQQSVDAFRRRPLEQGMHVERNGAVAERDHRETTDLELRGSVRRRRAGRRCVPCRRRRRRHGNGRGQHRGCGPCGGSDRLDMSTSSSPHRRGAIRPSLAGGGRLSGGFGIGCPARRDSAAARGRDSVSRKTRLSAARPVRPGETRVRRRKHHGHRLDLIALLMAAAFVAGMIDAWRAAAA
jgi:hypothetical protein